MSTLPPFPQESPGPALTGIAFFSLAFGQDLASASSWLAAAGGLGVPVYGVGLLQDGAGQGALRPLTLRLEMDFSGHLLGLRAWVAEAGSAKLYLLDSDVAANLRSHRTITSASPGSTPGLGPERRLEQDLVLGIGGWRLLEALDLHPEVCHFDGGHGAFALLERARGFMRTQSQPLEVAMAVTRPGNLFTTRARGIEDFSRHAADRMPEALGAYARESLGISLEVLLALGRSDPGDALEPFTMEYLAMRGCGRAEGSNRQPFEAIFPRWPLQEVPLEPLAPWGPAYAESHYGPAAECLASRSADRGEVGWRICDWRRSLQDHWSGLHFRPLNAGTRGPEQRLEVAVFSEHLDAHAFKVEIYAELAGRSMRMPMERVGPLGGLQGGFTYQGRILESLGATECTVRAIPTFPGVAVPLEESHIAWQR